MATSFASLRTKWLFLPPQAFSGKFLILSSPEPADTDSDIYAPHQKKTDFPNLGKDLGGIFWEEDTVRHREVAKKISPAFSNQLVPRTTLEREIAPYARS